MFTAHEGMAMDWSFSSGGLVFFTILTSASLKQTLFFFLYPAVYFTRFIIMKVQDGIKGPDTVEFLYLIGSISIQYAIVYSSKSLWITSHS